VKLVVRIAAAMWILINLYVWVVVSLPPSLAQDLPPVLSTYYTQHRALLTRMFYRPYVWSPEGR
jgi:hypothetical protein